MHQNLQVSDIKQRFATKKLLSYQEDVQIQCLTVTLHYIFLLAPSDSYTIKDKCKGAKTKKKKKNNAQAVESQVRDRQLKDPLSVHILSIQWKENPSVQ